jgi:hypothetical protein
MKPNLRMPILLLSFFVCNQTQPTYINFMITSQKNGEKENPYDNISSIPVPHLFSRIDAEKKSFAEWLRALMLKKSKTV